MNSAQQGGETFPNHGCGHAQRRHEGMLPRSQPDDQRWLEKNPRHPAPKQEGELSATGSPEGGGGNWPWHAPLLLASGSGIVGLVNLCVLALAFVFSLSGVAGFCGGTSDSPVVATNSDVSEPIPKLQPPLPQIPPTFWEQHGLAVSCAGSALGIAGAYAAWRLTRPKPPVFLPPLQQARAELEPLRNQPESGVLLSRVSQVVRHYFTAAFNLPAVELTTAEFCKAISNGDKLGPELASGVAGFLRQCDERKFAPLPVQPPLGAVSVAANLIDQAESRRAAHER